MTRVFMAVVPTGCLRPSSLGTREVAYKSHSHYFYGATQPGMLSGLKNQEKCLPTRQ